ncbi:hypothetical protein Ancab_004449 [Ancistrocladus abbreviatus]
MDLQNVRVISEDIAHSIEKVLAEHNGVIKPLMLSGCIAGWFQAVHASFSLFFSPAKKAKDCHSLNQNHANIEE